MSESPPVVKPRVVEVPLFQGPDLAKIKELNKAVELTMGRTDVRRLGDGDSEATAAARAHDAFVEEAKDRAVMVTLAALGRRQWRDLVLAHPPRDDEKMDQELGFNVQEVGEQLIPMSLMKPDSYPRFEEFAEAEVWVDKLSHADFQRLYNAAYVMNTDSTDPKADLAERLAAAASRLGRSGAETSTSPSRLGEASES